MSDKVTQLPVAHRPHDTVLRIEVHGGGGRCTHLGVTYCIRDGESHVTCGGCAEKLDPIWVLRQLAFHERRLIDGRTAYLEAKQAAEKRLRTKCEHCGKTTKIRI